MHISLRPSIPQDIDWLVELRARVLRADLERLGRYDERRVRERMRRSFNPEWTRIISVAGSDVGCITTRTDGPVRWIEHFYLEPALQGRGVGSEVLRRVAAEAFTGSTRLNVLQGSAARRLYERHGFITDSEDDVDVYMTLKSPDHA
ncbi:GNAT family N-acetyltransferase [Microbacterium flavum]|uniref:GNAT family N-acetyltransferase n=1 Tax=Microbacterium flavum TaxID=415216 RepID=A0ABS5XWF5_9MICO|nr:GNAT family N-acetyltransferase [Microbacterium flavum]MBT8798736.1 GNAT family N-acetyltransferase [Microbacterium flavum]